MKLKFKKLHDDAVLPIKAKPGDAGLDITTVNDGAIVYDQIIYKLGLAVEIPEGHVGYLFPRSSVVKTSLALANCVGVIDSGYRGELSAVFNMRNEEVLYKKGDRVVQLVVMPIPEIETEWTEEMTKTERGVGGFGSSGR